MPQNPSAAPVKEPVFTDVSRQTGSVPIAVPNRAAFPSSSSFLSTDRSLAPYSSHILNITLAGRTERGERRDGRTRAQKEGFGWNKEHLRLTPTLHCQARWEGGRQRGKKQVRPEGSSKANRGCLAISGLALADT